MLRISIDIKRDKKSFDMHIKNPLRTARRNKVVKFAVFRFKIFINGMAAIDTTKAETVIKNLNKILKGLIKTDP